MARAVRPGLAVDRLAERGPGRLERGPGLRTGARRGVGAERGGERLVPLDEVDDGVTLCGADDRGEVSDLLARLLDPVLHAAVAILDRPVVGDDQVGLQRRGLLDVDLAPLLAEDLDAGEVDVPEADILVERAIRVDRDRRDAELHQGGRGVGVGDDPLRYRVEGDGLSGSVRPGEPGRGGGRRGARFGARRRCAGRGGPAIGPAGGDDRREHAGRDEGCESAGHARAASGAVVRP